ncbi:MAG: PQQ-binding-like beta-propeller repeat protein [Chloroflexi bacterium]|nr:PQQ-binding-like beta-propeller repeat protein [Chloroflexota bacterium]
MTTKSAAMSFSGLQSQRKKTNWPLLIGAILVGFMAFLAILGPSFAPQNPMKENYALKVNDKIRVPPYPAFEVPGYFLGTDQYGRDLLSRILWAVRPTMIMVVTVAGVRLILGLVLGMIIGWSEGSKSRLLESLLSTALSIPVLIAALIGIFMAGIDRGLWAFIFGLGLTGWAETARMVSEQTRMIKSQTFIEAARALGASDRRILYSHVLRQIMSLLWMLLAFEISSTLLVSAELGFLGYFIGGGIWVEISDFNAVNVEGLPELGQMISSSLVKITDPSTLIIVGSVIGIGVLGFNLLGEGLRLRLSQEWLRGRRRFRFLSEAAEEWFEERLLRPALFWIESHRTALSVATVILIILSGSWLAFKALFIKPLAASESTFITSGSQPLWATDRHDPYGTLWVPVSLDSEPKVIWNIPLANGTVGRPSVKEDGTIFVLSKAKELLAISPDGQMIWKAPLDEIPVGAPALDATGRIIVADAKGYVTVFDENGNRLWHVLASNGREATSGPLVDAKGNIYLTAVDTVAALSPDGTSLWRTKAADTYLEEPPRLSPDQSLIFLKNSAIQTDTGSLKTIEIAPPQELLFTDPTFFSGANGLNYYRLGHEIIGWHFEGADLIIDSRQTWVHEGTVLLLPYDQGVTKGGLTWFYYTMFGVDTRMIWLDAQSRVIGNYSFQNPNPKLIAIGEKGEAILCGSVTVRVNCINIAPGAKQPTWNISIESPAPLLGGAMIPGRLYLTLDDGLYALEAQEK